jgi:hypothetical protein
VLGTVQRISDKRFKSVAKKEAKFASNINELCWETLHRVDWMPEFVPFSRHTLGERLEKR